MVKELRISRASPFDERVQALLVPPKVIEPPDLSHMTGPNAYFYLAERDDEALGCIALRNEGSFGLVVGFHFRSDTAGTSLPEILIEQVETQARTLRLPVLRVWVGEMHPKLRAAFVRSGYFPDPDRDETTGPRLYERPLKRRVQAPPAVPRLRE